jgi:hypothetical protein
MPGENTARMKSWLVPEGGMKRTIVKLDQKLLPGFQSDLATASNQGNRLFPDLISSNHTAQNDGWFAAWY